MSGAVCDVCDVAIVDNVQRKQSLAGMQLVHGRQSSFFSLSTEQKRSVHAPSLLYNKNEWRIQRVWSWRVSVSRHEVSMKSALYPI